MPISIVIAEDHALFRGGLKQILSLREDLEVVGEAGDGLAAVETTLAMRPDLLLLDLSMPGRDGLEVLARIRKDAPATFVLIISMHATIDHLRAAFRAGAHGYLLKSADTEEFLFAIQSVLKGNHYISTELTGSFVGSCLRGEEPALESPVEKLTLREREVLKLVAEGRSNKEIAEEFDIAEKTVVTHRTNLMRKLDLHNVREVTMFALQNGLIEMQVQ